MTRFFQCMVWVGSVLLVGCATPPAPSADGDGVSIRSFSVASPGELAVGEPLQVQVTYRFSTGGTALLQVRPYFEGREVPGHRANVAIPVSVGLGDADCWISFPTTATVDELRVSLFTLPRYRLLAESRQDVNFTWR